ncbi:PAS domain S-box protein [Mesorhizobium sp. B283B1A]|uniref:PAS domain S-box protein n=1 Tax=Mesorhizobium TaxID=68287 RepID=UPI001CD16CD2|nr:MULTISPECIES: PAS domain S-box protein [Mesorhizobium]MCA0051449.1 PAS domain S-box protein [Mesorhizobium sp. B283B1A]UQS66483.1 PAS domain S-box protein [Mesorhizobium opportunistum]
MQKSGEQLTARLDELSALYVLTDRLYRAKSNDDAFDAGLDAIRDGLGCRRASMLLFDEAGVMRFVAWRGLSGAYRQALEGHSPWKVGERNAEPIFVSDIAETEEPAIVKATISSEGIVGLAFIPLVAQGEVVGKFMTYYEQKHSFARHEIDLATTIARQIGFYLERTRAEEARKLAADELRASEQQFRLMSEHAPVMIWTCDASGKCTNLNSMLREFWGVASGDIPNFNWHPTIHPDDATEIGARMAQALASQSTVSVQGRYKNRKGDYRVLLTTARPHFSAKGQFRGLIGVNVDVTESEKAEAALRHSEERFRSAVEAAPSGMVMTDGNGRIILVNLHAETVFGYEREEMIGQGVEMLVPERSRDAHPEFRGTYATRPLARPMGAGRDLYARRKDGSEVPVEIGLSPIATSEGLMTLASVVDISERKRSEIQRELLMAELNHRVKNTLAVVQGIAHQTFRGTLAKEAYAAFEGRLMALSAAHNLLTQTSWEHASLDQLVCDSLQFRGTFSGRVASSGPAVLLQPNQALSIALALHELLTNAVKYGALSNEAGKVSVEWSRTDRPKPRLKLIWSELGGPAVSSPSRRGFGSRLIVGGLAADLQAEVTMEFEPQGLVCRIDAPLPEGTLAR